MSCSRRKHGTNQFPFIFVAFEAVNMHGSRPCRLDSISPLSSSWFWWSGLKKRVFNNTIWKLKWTNGQAPDSCDAFFELLFWMSCVCSHHRPFNAASHWIEKQFSRDQLRLYILGMVFLPGLKFSSNPSGSFFLLFFCYFIFLFPFSILVPPLFSKRRSTFYPKPFFLLIIDSSLCPINILPNRLDLLSVTRKLLIKYFDIVFTLLKVKMISWWACVCLVG